MRAPHAILLAVAVAASAGAARADVAARGLDAVTRPGEPVDLAAKFEHGGHLLWHPDIEHERVVFEVAGQRLERWSDADGVARLRVRPSSAGIVPFEARLRDAPDAPVARGRLFVLDPAKPVAIVDIDGTLSDLPTLLVPFRGAEADTFPGAPDLVEDLARDHQNVYLTARDDVFDGQTRAFLQRHGFPDAPIIYNDLGLDTAEERSQILEGNQHEHKIAQIERLQDMGLDVRLGLGDSETDVKAYEATGIDSYIRDGDEESGPSFHFTRTPELRRRLVADGHLPASPGLAGAVAGSGSPDGE